MIWYALIVPLIGAIYLVFKYGKHLQWWSYVLPFVACLIFIAIFKFTIRKIQTTDTEYWGGLATKAQYYEAWSSWVDETCSYTTSCCCDSKGNNCQTETHYYDCSYCNSHGPRWTMTTTLGTTIDISQEKYKELESRWKAQRSFHDMQRSIVTHGSCGVDGNMYEIAWDGDPLSAEPVTEDHFYENRTQAAHDVFKFHEVTEKEKQLYCLYEYPKIQGYSQDALLGGNSLPWLSPSDRDTLSRMLKFWNGDLGTKKQLKVWMLLYPDMPLKSAELQKDLWQGGNKNELIICIGVNKSSPKPNWCKVISWTPKSGYCEEIEQNIMGMESFTQPGIRSLLERELPLFERKHFREFSYLRVDPPLWAIIVTYIVTILITILISYWEAENFYEYHKETQA